MSFLRVVVFAFLTAKKINMQSNKLIPAPHPDNDRADVLSMCGESVSSSRRCTLLQSCTVRGPLPRASPLLLSFVFSPFLFSSLLCSSLLSSALRVSSFLSSFPLSFSLLFSCRLVFSHPHISSVSARIVCTVVDLETSRIAPSVLSWTWRPLELVQRASLSTPASCDLHQGD